MKRAAGLVALALLLALPLATARTSAGDGDVLRDAEFGVAAPGAIGLERNVAMYQWTADGNATAWSDTPVEVTHGDRGNPDELPLASRRWGAAKVSLDGYPVAPSAIRALAEWEPLRPDFSALPGNLSATFQPEGDGLGSAANPMAPEIGDLRITWRALRMPPTRAPLELRDGRWELRPGGAVATTAAAEAAGAPRGGTWAWTILGMFAGALFVGLVLLFRRRRG